MLKKPGGRAAATSCNARRSMASITIKGCIMRIFLLLAFLLASPLCAQIVDLSKHTSLKGAYLLAQPQADFVTVQMLLNVGEADYDGPEGLAHYLEHLVWYSSDKAHGAGTKQRVSNAWTNTLFTNYWNAGEPSTLDKMLAVSARIFAPIDVDPVFARQERDIVEREFDLRTLDNSKRQLYDRMVKALLPDHGLSRSTIGTRESLRQITPEMVQTFRDTWYWPNNAVLLVSGPVDQSDLVPLLERHLSNLPQGDLPAHPWAAPIVWDGREVEASLSHPKVKEPYFAILNKAPRPPEMSPEQATHAVRILGEWLNSSAKSSPRKTLYYDDFTLSEIEVYAWHDQAGTINLEVIAVPEADVSLETAIKASKAFFAQLETLPLEDFEQVTTAMLEPMMRKKDQPKFQTDIAFRGLLERGKPYEVAAYIAALQAVEPAHIEQLLHALRSAEISVTGIARPKEN